MEVQPSEVEGAEHERSFRGERIIATSGYLLIAAAVVGFLAAGGVQIYQALNKPRYAITSWLQLIQDESATLTLLVMAVVAATLGKQLLTTARLSEARTIPYEDLPLVRQAVIDGKPEPIDQYVRLRSLSGISGNFTKLGVTGLPLTTVVLTLVFAAVALTPSELAQEFLDLAKLTLGAFIGSFVQRQVEHRKQDAALPPGSPPRQTDLIA